jgi:hypothetical protein
VRDRQLERMALAVLNWHQVADSPMHWVHPRRRRHALEFHSIGWDLEARHLKLYMFCEHALLPPDAASLLPEQTTGYRSRGLLSYTYSMGRPASPEGAALLVETKVYLYPNEPTRVAPLPARCKDEATGVPAGARGGRSTCAPLPVRSEAHMFSSERGLVVQYDLPWEESQKERQLATERWRDMLDARGQEALLLAARDGIWLDTIAFASFEEYTLYLPGW